MPQTLGRQPRAAPPRLSRCPPGHRRGERRRLVQRSSGLHSRRRSGCRHGPLRAAAVHRRGAGRDLPEHRDHPAPFPRRPVLHREHRLPVPVPRGDDERGGVPDQGPGGDGLRLAAGRDQRLRELLELRLRCRGVHPPGDALGAARGDAPGGRLPRRVLGDVHRQPLPPDPGGRVGPVSPRARTRSRQGRTRSSSSATTNSPTRTDGGPRYAGPVGSPRRWRPDHDRRHPTRRCLPGTARPMRRALAVARSERVLDDLEGARHRTGLVDLRLREYEQATSSGSRNDCNSSRVRWMASIRS